MGYMETDPVPIDYSNPIPANSTGTIKPKDGAFYTSTSKLVTLTGSGAQKFTPGTETSRIIWGDGAGAAITITVDPINLKVGGIFEIKLDDGESRQIRYDGTDFHKIGGVIKPMSFLAETDTLQDKTAESQWVNIDLEDEVYDNGNIFASHTFTPARNAIWNFMTLLGIQADTGETLERAASSIMESSVPTYVMTDTRPGSVVADNPLRDSGVRPRKIIAGNGYRFGALALTSGGNNYEILGDSSVAKTSFAGEEVVEW
jgi:hypothetical protein